MANPELPTVGLRATGDVVKRSQRALLPNIRSFNSIDTVFGPKIEAVKLFHEDQLTVGGIVDPETWAGGRRADADASERSCGNAQVWTSTCPSRPQPVF
jgi:hypothetical protein